VRRTRVWGGGLLLALAGAIALESTTFVVGFPTDPLGPSAFPLLAAALIALGGLALLAGGDAFVQHVPRDGLVRVALATLSFVAYALLLDPLGFVPATALEFVALATLFGGRPLPGLAAGLVFTFLLFALFVYGLGLPLPLGLLER